MVSFFKTFLLFIFAVNTAYSLPGFPTDLHRRDIDWGNYVYIASIFSGLVGQNIALIALPGVSHCPRKEKKKKNKTNQTAHTESCGVPRSALGLAKLCRLLRIGMHRRAFRLPVVLGS